MHAELDELFSLKGRTAVVTGGSSGIGKEMARTVSRAGAAVVLVARRSEPLRATADELTAEGGTASWLSGDLGDRAGIKRVIDELTTGWGTPDILINAAGINLRPPLGALTEAEWDRTMAANLDAPFLLGQRFGPAMATAGWGRIINLASQQSIRAFGNSGAYGVSKAAITGLTRAQAEAWSASGVCVNAIAPGFVHTPLTEAVFRDPQRVQAMADRTMAGRNGEQRDFAGVTAFLASNAGAYVTGQTIFVDGGFSVH
ncbi:SDR family NAD(P)-dependent oxidoreductase [Actinoplanes sp. N902-109]|uniref:SDR family NAD(P)-dependent oxidoreductase n=1 Tax=Actinoplanes sp. (strain N902-109) TaxID=649831 RepID=UPI0003294262|nr:SDR family oxidoreductase [Actinoplanes sp. N902-109]AGL16993.1 putative dehydrogenase [Actinoplanes sp. N902-109]